MFSKVITTISLCALFLGVSAAPSDSNQCNGGQVQCCNKVQDSKSLDAGVKGLLGVLNIDLSQLTGQVGVTCTAVNVVGVGGGSHCSNQAVCCNNNNFNGVVALGCTPINVSV
ncbi:hypothetical protein CC1G_06484 [Coprinopsis cinerea okayama7|uniref:Hydrophobin n=1 Tax=Coprinopsis cinerea (strain Okayama-7 / 130 / ATCC MYA-4618 / FGSC 9003) TaxID=240176 RepID=A8NNA1_COPC7|nr:hypothetical protein CC1G_06484 [Coprinopsis cinerea okayama7\|eukprot:XP_001835081.2 hypothetical protein CC1G_06484 [Coprinopsis cinerea okayama7\